MCHQHCETDTSSPRPRVSSVTVSLWNTYLLTSASGLFCHSIIVIHIPLDLGLMSLLSKYHCETHTSWPRPHVSSVTVSLWNTYLLTSASCLFCQSIIVKHIPLDLGLVSLPSKYHCETDTSWPRPHVSSVTVSLWYTYLLTSASCLFRQSIIVKHTPLDLGLMSLLLQHLDIKLVHLMNVSCRARQRRWCLQITVFSQQLEGSRRWLHPEASWTIPDTPSMSQTNSWTIVDTPSMPQTHSWIILSNHKS